MKKTMFLVVAAFALASCEKYNFDEEKPEPYDWEEVVYTFTKKFTFTVKGDFSGEWKPITRGYLQADGRDLTDLWVLDYMNGELVQQFHQDDNTASDFGKPVMQLKYGQHHVYFVASRGGSPVLSTDAHTITFSPVRDTFWKDYEVTVVATSNGNRAVTLDRVVTKLSLTFTDAIPDNAATFNVTPATWYYGIDYLTGEPVEPKMNEVITVNIPSTSVGQSNVPVSMYGFSSATEWTTNLSVNSKTSGGDVISEVSIANVPLKRNRVTEYSGPLFGSSGTMDMSLNDTWDTSVTGTW